MEFQFASKSKQRVQQKSSATPSTMMRSFVPAHTFVQLQRNLGNSDAKGMTCECNDKRLQRGTTGVSGSLSGVHSTQKASRPLGTRPCSNRASKIGCSFSQVPVSPSSQNAYVPKARFDFDRVRIFPKLVVTPAHDPLEAEADRIADAVLRQPEPRPVDGSQRVQSAASRSATVQRQVSGLEEDEDNQSASTASELSFKRDASANTSTSLPEGLARAQDLTRGSGQPLGNSVQNFFEPRFNHDFSRVRIHTDEYASGVAKRLNARAFTVGNDIVFAKKEYTPNSSTGARLLAHELTHVIQQKRGGVSLMRACNCSSMGARNPTSREQSVAIRNYPNLASGDWCVSGAATPTYNCIAWTVGDTTQWIWNQVDNPYGDRDGTVSISDFDAFYTAFGHAPPTDMSLATGEIALFSKGTDPKHAAIKTAHTCDGETMFESKRGRNIRIIHKLSQLEGGLYGNVVKFYP